MLVVHFVFDIVLHVHKCLTAFCVKGRFVIFVCVYARVCVYL